VSELRGSDLAQVTDQLGREPLTPFAVVARCGSGHPLVIRNHPVDREGHPFPTLYWLTCPQAVRAVSRLESEGWIKHLDEQSERDPELGEALEGAHRAHADERGRWVQGAERWGGVGGSRSGVKCLHAHYAHHLAGGPDPVGAWVADRVEPFHADEDRSGRVAAVDMGTNSIRLLVARAGGSERDGDIAELGRDMVITRLGEGVDRTGRLDPGALRRTTDVLEQYVRRARALGAKSTRVGATSAVRDAGDVRLLDRAVAELTGSPPEVLTGEREAGLSFLGATLGLDREPPFLVFDIGGGSTELVLGRDEPEAAVSIDIGSVRITERIQPADPPTGEDLEAMRRLAAEAMEDAVDAVPPGRARTLVGVAGTTTTVQAVALELDRYDPDAIHRTVLTREAAERVTTALARMTTAQRAGLPVMAPGREDVIVAGCAILLEIFRRWEFEECVVSERDLLDGLAIEMVRETAGR
jgi:exopolyphosphatase/guanosine-5'-triphosphate,3'-diphosphate pyrophosphatase